MFPLFFRKPSTENPQEKSYATKTFETLMQARFDRLEHNFTALRTEWAETYDKIMHLYDRTRKRVKKTEVEASSDQPVMPIPSPQEQREMVLRAFNELNGRNNG